MGSLASDRQNSAVAAFRLIRYLSARARNSGGTRFALYGIVKIRKHPNSGRPPYILRRRTTDAMELHSWQRNLAPQSKKIEKMNNSPSAMWSV